MGRAKGEVHRLDEDVGIRLIVIPGLIKANGR